VNAAVETATHPGRANLRAYLAGSGATGALIAGAVVIFLAVGAFVAFSGMPFGGSGGGEGSASLRGQTAGGAPASAAAALAGASGAVAASPAGARGAAAGGSGSATSGSGGGRHGGTDPTDPQGTFSGGGGPPTGCTDSCTDPSTSGPIGNVVGHVDSATSQQGVNLHLGGQTAPLTDPVDHAITGGLNTGGGAVGKPHLGDKAGNAANGATDSLLGGG